MRFSAVALSACVAVNIFFALPAAAEDPAPSPGAASIRGDVVSGFLGSSTSSRIVAVDGRVLTGPVEPCNPVPLSSGPHSLVVEYDGVSLPVRIDAKPDTAYAVKWSTNKPRAVIVEEQNSHTVVTQIPVDIDDNAERYTVPAGSSHIATFKRFQVMRPNTVFDGEHKFGSVSVSAVDGRYVVGQEEARPRDKPDTLDLPVEPGIRAIMVGVYLNLGINPINNRTVSTWMNIPFILDVQPDTTYTIKYEPPVGFGRTIKLPMWVEDETQGKVIIPKAHYLMNYNDGRMTYLAGIPVDEKVTFPEGKGQLKRTPPKPKPWCEHD